MLKVIDQILDISGVSSLSSKLCSQLSIGDVIMLKGDLGVGKTTFARSMINELHLLNNNIKPITINSPTYPILLTYDLKLHEIYHYDLYRIKTIKELEELDFFENINNSITIIEWPELLINLPFLHKHYLITLSLYSETERVINIEYFE